MSYSASDFHPSEPILIINGFDIPCKLITLKIETRLEKLYGDLDTMFKAINEEPLELIRVFWELVDKSFFENNFIKYQNFILEEGDPAEAAKEMRNTFNYIIKASAPLIKNLDRHKEANKIKGVQQSDGPCYVVYYDRISKRYGYTIEEFYNLTLREIHMLLKVSDDEAHKELEVQASLHDKKLKERIKINDISVEEEKEQEQQAMDAFKELQKRYKKNKEGK